jgi:hypothetical protein
MTELGHDWHMWYAIIDHMDLLIQELWCAERIGGDKSCIEIGGKRRIG